ncbi:NAD-dependent DNA ligase LigA, partial [Patescibacteria group bacterium]|nr:NAD-dependent DNA ligase LigA [Patescibacteria group bacterium]
MNKAEAKNRINKLKSEIEHHRYLYHVLDKQEISDAALDSLKHELTELESQFPDLLSPDSPSQRVSGVALSKFKKIPHQVRMLSLNDSFSLEEMQEWENRIKKLVPGEKLEYYAELKIDGLAMSLIYLDGILQTAATRGNGRVGEDVTENIKTIESIPLKLRGDYKSGVEVRGEVYMDKKTFEKINREQKKK